MTRQELEDFITQLDHNTRELCVYPHKMTIDCNDCGYTDDMNDTCPECGSHNIRRLRRVTGYLTGDYKSAFNKGKQQEVEMRVKHK